MNPPRPIRFNEFDALVCGDSIPHSRGVPVLAISILNIVLLRTAISAGRTFSCGYRMITIVTKRVSISWWVILLAAVLPVASTVSQAAVLCGHLGESSANHLEFAHGADQCNRVATVSCGATDPLSGEHPPCDDVQLDIDQVCPDQSEAVGLVNYDTFEWVLPLDFVSWPLESVSSPASEDDSSAFSAGLRVVRAVRFNL